MIKSPMAVRNPNTSGETETQNRFKWLGNVDLLRSTDNSERHTIHPNRANINANIKDACTFILLQPAVHMGGCHTSAYLGAIRNPY